MRMAKIGIVAGAVAASVASGSLSHSQDTKKTARSEPGFQELAEWVRRNGKAVVRRDPYTRIFRALGATVDADVSATSMAYYANEDPSSRYAFDVASIDGHAIA
jgi:hypothetical protein